MCKYLKLGRESAMLMSREAKEQVTLCIRGFLQVGAFNCLTASFANASTHFCCAGSRIPGTLFDVVATRPTRLLQRHHCKNSHAHCIFFRKFARKLNLYSHPKTIFPLCMCSCMASMALPHLSHTRDNTLFVAQVFSLLVASSESLLHDIHGFDCFCAYFADVNYARGLLECSGRLGKRPGRRLSGHALVGRRVAIRRFENKKMHIGTVTKYEKSAMNAYLISWEKDGEEDKKDLESSGTEWSLVEDESGVAVPVCIVPFFCADSSARCRVRTRSGAGTHPHA